MALADHGWVFAGYELHWRRDHQGPIHIEVLDTTGSTSGTNWAPLARQAAKDWKKAETLNTNWNVGKSPVLRDHDGTGLLSNCVATSNCIVVLADDYGNNGWLGLGGGWIEYDPVADQVHWILGGAWMNDFYYDNIPFYDTHEWRQTVMCQEIGHALGLGHVDENFFNEPSGTCMDYSIDPAPNQHPFAHDYEVLDEFHGHVHEFESAGGPPPTIPPGIAQGDWGNLLSESAAGSVYLKDLGNNQYWITHVTWAQEQ
jgi:hypothetical protein